MTDGEIIAKSIDGLAKAINGLIDNISQNKPLKMTLEELIKIEPQLERLRDDIVYFMTGSPGSWAKKTGAWYHEFKPRFGCLVGFGAKKPELRSCEVYDFVYKELCTILKIWND